uniref:EF-hand domain-containing protein n=1 Tax=Picea sitchensis TaxID=3332 RepID=A9NM84_PICSI|nr:unknown [Picea sitchensis]
MALSIDIDELRRLYETINENGDGRLTVNEMNRSLNRIGIDISEEDLKYLVIPMSQSEDGSLTFDEFVGLCQSILDDTRSEDELRNGEEGCEDLMEAFKVYDMNNDGFISSTELQRVLCNLGFVEGEELDNCQKMICRYDSDSNGRLDFLEFKNMMTSKITADPHRSQSLPLHILNQG